MLSHQKIAENIYKITYETGIIVIVNYNNEEFIIEERVVPGKSYKLINGTEG